MQILDECIIHYSDIAWGKNVELNPEIERNNDKIEKCFVSHITRWLNILIAIRSFCNSDCLFANLTKPFITNLAVRT